MGWQDPDYRWKAKMTSIRCRPSTKNTHKGASPHVLLTRRLILSPCKTTTMWHCSNDCVILQQETFTKPSQTTPPPPPTPPTHRQKLCLALSDAAPHRFVFYLGEDVGALLQQRDGRFSQAGGQLNPEQLLLLGEVVLQGVSQRHGGTPVGQGIRWEQASAQQLARWDAIRLWDKKKKFNYLTHLANQKHFIMLCCKYSSWNHQTCDSHSGFQYIFIFWIFTEKWAKVQLHVSRFLNSVWNTRQ